jgi:hypothetical protein
MHVHDFDMIFTTGLAAGTVPRLCDVDKYIADVESA